MMNPIKWGWAEKLEVGLDHRLPEQKVITVKTKGGVSIQLQIESADGLACSFAYLSITGATLDSEITVQEWAEGIVSRVTYLSEPLRAIEVEYDWGAQIKSDPPDRRDGAVHYYEFLLKAHRGHPLFLGCRRWCYRKSENEISLTAVPCVLTLETLKRLVSDLEAAWPAPALTPAEATLSQE